MLHPNYLELLTWPSGLQEITGWEVGCYPNPGRDVVNLSFEGKLTVRCTDTQGREVARVVARNGVQLQTDTWIAGMYFIELGNAYGGITSVKWVKIHAP